MERPHLHKVIDPVIFAPHASLHFMVPMSTHPPPILQRRGSLFSWTLFDFANTSFYVVVITLVLPTFFQEVIGAQALGKEMATAWWGRALSISMLITAAIGPPLGSLADAGGRKKFLLALFTTVTVVATAGLWFTGPGTVALALILVVLANVGFEGGTIFYDAFLPEIATPNRYARVSGYGFAMGYLGSFATLVLVQQILAAADAGGWPDYAGPRATFLLAAGMFAIFSLPLFLVVRERRVESGGSTGSLLRESYRRLADTFAHIRSYSGVRRFLLAFFVYNDSILTVIAFASLFASDVLKMTTEQRILFFMIVQGTALAGSLLFGWITNRIGVRQSIIVTLLLWIGVVVAAYGVETVSGFYIIGGVAGLALGSSQSSSRAMMALLTPMEKRAEFFGFYDGFFGKASAVVGPLVFGEVAAAYGQRPAMLVIGAFFILGILLMLRTPNVRADERQEPVGLGVA